MLQPTLRQPVILSAVRTPVGKFQGALASFSATELFRPRPAAFFWIHRISLRRQFYRRSSHFCDLVRGTHHGRVQQK